MSFNPSRIRASLRFAASLVYSANVTPTILGRTARLCKTVRPSFLGGSIYLAQRERAAFLAISLRCFLVSFAALAFPPLLAPSLLRATAAGLRVSGGGGGALPVAISTTALAI